MSEKRFYNDGKYVMQNGEVYVACAGEHNADVVATALNELLEENNQLSEENKQLKKTLKQSYLNEICENCVHGHYFRSYNYGGFEGDFECKKGHDGADCDGLKDCDDFELRY